MQTSLIIRHPASSTLITRALPPPDSACIAQSAPPTPAPASTPASLGPALPLVALCCFLKDARTRKHTFMGGTRGGGCEGESTR
jgi:hypothetical protein